MFGRNRESRSREAAGRRNWPEAVPKKMRGRKRLHTQPTEISLRGKRAERQAEMESSRVRSGLSGLKMAVTEGVAVCACLPVGEDT